MTRWNCEINQHRSTTLSTKHLVKPGDAALAWHKLVTGLLSSQNLTIGDLVAFTGRVAAGGLIFLLAAMLGAVLLVVDWVANLSLALATVAGLGVIGMWFWWIQPVRWLAGTERLEPTDSAHDADVGPGETNGSR